MFPDSGGLMDFKDSGLRGSVPKGEGENSGGFGSRRSYEYEGGWDEETKRFLFGCDIKCLFFCQLVNRQSGIVSAFQTLFSVCLTSPYQEVVEVFQVCTEQDNQVGQVGTLLGTSSVGCT